eukprot:CAMPEP_0115058092 /NCGR_PEP_ID=MMETSP0227-20121206/6145_1 /TAXON_ID=89957 /ORGANISM="Polarella glacialis, Strain CCMP 1383" /LENGTH=440 /DNA_ID=CAMNT_0002443015 /DNA_START=34 /DNA_END=1356 /DNA_ORIENTATION=+
MAVTRRCRFSPARSLVAVCCVPCLLQLSRSCAFAAWRATPERTFDIQYSYSVAPGALLKLGSRHFAAGPRQGLPEVRNARLAKQASADKSEAEEAGGAFAQQAALFLSYFALQSGMSFFMKFVLSKVRVAQNLFGVPASFLVTSSQQLVGFALFLLLVLGSRLIGKPYKPKALARKELLLVLALSASFTLNIGLNLLSLSLIPLSLTMIIRGCSPLSTSVLQSVMMSKRDNISAGEWACMLFGVGCASAVVFAQSGGLTGNASKTFFFGVAMAVASLFSSALDFVFKGLLGSGSVKLNALDTTCYMAIPAALMTSLLGAVLVKPVSSSWAAHFGPTMTDVAVFSKLWEINPTVFGWILASGLFAFVYNTFVTFMVVKLSPATTAFAGNFNKAATILVSLLLLEGNLPTGIRGVVMIGAIIGNIGAFAVYNILKKRRQSQK